MRSAAATSGLCLLALCAALLVRVPSSSASEPAKELRPYVSWVVQHSRIETAEYLRITSKAEWTRLWLRHIGSSSKPERYSDYYNPDRVPTIDFEHCMVVAVTAGKRHNAAGVDAVSITDEGDLIRLRFRDRTFQTSGPDGGAQQVTPIGLFVLPRSASPIVLEEDVQNLIRGDPIWKQRARLP